MRRILAVVLIICLTWIPYVQAENTTDNEYTQYYDALNGLNIICGYEKFDFNSTMQRYEFANMIANLYGETAYTNIKSDDAIALVHAHGLINSIESFNPYADILYEEAVKMAVCALGYGAQADYQGGWPHGYLKIANQIGILKGVSGAVNTPMIRGNLVMLIYNTMSSAVMEQTVYGETFENYELSEDETLLSLYRNIYEITEVLDGTEYTMLYSSSKLAENEISVGGKIYEYSDEAPDSFLGSTVRAYIRKDDFKDKLIYMHKYYEEDTLRISASDYMDINDSFTELRYYSDEDKETTVKIAKSAYVIYNGEFCADYNKDDFSVDDGFIMLTDSNDDRVYDVIKIMEYDNMYVSMISASGRFVVGEFEYEGALSMLELSDDKTDAKIRYFSPDGAVLNFEAIAPKQILSVSKSKSEKEPVLTIYISDSTAEGVVSQLKNDNIFVMNDMEYTLASSYTEANAKGEEFARLNILGQNVVLYMDAFGMVAASHPVGASSMTYAYATQIASDGLWSPDVRLRMFESDEVWREYTLAEKVKWNGELLQAQKVYDGLLASGRFIPQLIGYELNGDSEIRRLETGVASDDTERLRMGEEVTGMYTSTNRSINWNVFFDDNTVVWIIPDDTENESEYRIDNHMYFVHLEQHNATPYNLDDYKFAPMVTVKEGKGYFDGIKDTGTMYVYVGSGETMDESGNIVKMIEYVGGSSGMTEAAVSEYCEIPDLKKGDAVKIRVNKNNVITNIERCFAFSDKGTEKVPASFYTTELMAGYVKKVDYARQRFTVECGGEQTVRNDINSATTTFIVNRNDAKETIETCGFNDIEIGDYVVIRAQHSRLYDVYIIKDV